MATEAVVELIVDASRAERDVESQLRDIVRDAERGAPVIELDADASGSGPEVESQVRDIVRDAERGAPDIRLDAEATGEGVAAQVRDIVSEAERGAPTITLETEAAGSGVSAQVRDIVREAERGAPTIDLDVDVDDSGATATGRSLGARILSGITGSISSGASSAFSAGLRGAQAGLGAISTNPWVAAAGAILAAGVVATAAPLIGALLSGISISVLGLGFIGLGAVLLKSEPEVVAAATELKDTVLKIFREAAQPLKGPIVAALNSLAETAKVIAPQIRAAFQAVADSGAIQALADGISLLAKNALPGMVTALERSGPVFEGLKGLLSQIGTGLSEFFTILSGESKNSGKALEDLGRLIRLTLNILARVFADLAETYGTVREFVGKVIASFQRLYDVLVGHSIVPDLIDRIVALFRSLPGRALGALAALGRSVTSQVSSAMNSMRARIGSGLSSAVSLLRSLPGRAQSALGGLGGALVSSGRALINGFISGIRSQIGQVAEAASAVVAAARDFFPFSPAKKGPFSGKGWTLYSGRKVIEDFVRGIEQERGTVAGALSRTLRGEPRLGGGPGATLASAASSWSPLLSGPMSVGAPNVAVYIGNERLNGFVDARIDGRNSVRDRQAAQGARF